MTGRDTSHSYGIQVPRRYATLIAAILSILLAGQPARSAWNLNEMAYLTFDEDQGVSTMIVTNTLPVPITASIELSLTNMFSSNGERFEVVIPASSRRELSQLRTLNRRAAYYYRYNWHFKFGSAKTGDDALGVFRLPYRDGESYPIIQGYDGTWSHRGDMRHSIDWEMPEGTPLVAAKGGIVVETASHFTEAGGEELKDKVNFVTIVHDDGTLADYVHLMPDGVEVKQGQRVAVGEVIGYSGHTGWSTTPHLHFRVYRPVDGNSIVSLPTKFLTAESEPIALEEGMSPTACPLP